MLYVGRRYKASVEGTTWKPVQCERCGAQWAYHVRRQSTGEGVSPYMLDNAGAQQRASAAARRNLELALKNARDDIPCPKCLAYPTDAVTRLRKAKYSWLFILGLVGLFGALMFGAPVVMNPELGLSPLAGLAVVFGLAAVGAVPLVLRHRFMAAYDPNTDELLDTRRDALAGKQTLLREQYEEIVRKARAEGREDQIVQIAWAEAPVPFESAAFSASALGR